LDEIISNAMRIKIISSREEINWLGPNEMVVYFLFRPISIDLLNLILKSPRLQMIQVPPSHLGALPKDIVTFLEVLDVKVLECEVWSNIKDIESYTFSDEALTPLSS
jgi:hypothetical protein